MSDTGNITAIVYTRYKYFITYNIYDENTLRGDGSSQVVRAARIGDMSDIMEMAAGVSVVGKGYRAMITNIQLLAIERNGVWEAVL